MPLVRRLAVSPYNGHIGTVLNLNGLKSKMAFWSDSLDFSANKLTDKSGNAANAPSLVKSYALYNTGYVGYSSIAYTPTVETEIEIAMKFTAVEAGNYYFGAYNGSGNFLFGTLTTGSIRVGYGQLFLDVAATLDTNYHIYKLNKNTFDRDGIQLINIATSGYTFGAAPTSLYFGNCLGINAERSCEIAYIRIKESGVLVREWLCSVGDITADGKIIYDTVNDAALTLKGTLIWKTQNNYHFNLQRGFDVWQNDSTGSYMYIPLKANGTSVKGSGATITSYTWVAKYTQDGSQLLPCETKLNMPLTTQLKALDLSNYWFNVAQNAANDIGYDDLAQTDFNYFNFTTNKDLVIGTEALPINLF